LIHHDSVLDNAKIRVVVALYPPALIQFRPHYEKLIVMILFNNGSGELSANARFAFFGDGNNVDCTNHAASFAQRAIVATISWLRGSWRGIGKLPARLRQIRPSSLLEITA
jgi:hypothetical protein